MKILLDECLPRKLAAALPEYDVTTVAEMGWSGSKDHALLRAAHDARFEALITIDKNLPFQQNVTRYQFGIIVIDARRNTFTAMMPLVPEILDALTTLRAGEVCVIHAKESAAPRRSARAAAAGGGLISFHTERGTSLFRRSAATVGGLLAGDGVT